MLTSNISEKQMQAICASQRYLDINGYLDSTKIPDKNKITLEMWEPISYEHNGQIDWDALLSDRHGTYVGKLYGVTEDNNDYTVFYRLAYNNYSFYMHESNCRLNKHVLRVNEKTIQCKNKQS